VEKIIEPQRRREHREKIDRVKNPLSVLCVSAVKSFYLLCLSLSKKPIKKASDVFSDTPVIYFMAVANRVKQSLTKKSHQN